MSDFQLTSHVRGRTLILPVRQLDADALQGALESLGSYFAENLARPYDELWGIRVVTRAGIFEFGDWSFDRWAGRGGALSADEGALAIFREWEEEARRDPAVALAATAELVRHCILEDPHPRRARNGTQPAGRRRGAQCEWRTIGMR